MVRSLLCQAVMAGVNRPHRATLPDFDRQFNRETVPCDISNEPSRAACLLECLPAGAQWDVLAHLYCLKFGMNCDPSALANAARCFGSCIPDGEKLDVIVYLLKTGFGNTQTPAELANSARCIESCIPAGLQLPVLIDLTCQSIP